MKITPLEIRQKEFNKNFRGYDKDEVTAFLQSMSTEWEKLLTEYQEVKKKLDESEKEVQKLREVENSLFKTLKTAEDTGANMVEQSKKAAELHLKEAKMQVDSMLNEANNRARKIIEEAEDIAASTFQNFVDELKEIEEHSKEIEKLRENFMSDIRGTAQDVIDKMQKMESKMHSTSELAGKIKEARKDFKGKKVVKELLEKGDSNEHKAKPPKTKSEDPIQEKQEEVQEENKKAEEKNTEGGSFFDQLG
jgi:cell division initiation protein